MTEEAQILAMIAELQARHFEVERDVPAEQLGSHWPNLTLDLVATRPTSGRFKHRMIVEIANRRRRLGAAIATEVAEESAIERFGRIADAIKVMPIGIEFQVRFLDVSADQAAARTLVGASAFNPASVQTQLAELDTMLANDALDERVRALAIVHEWARWLRMTAYRWPAAEKELPFADLRKIQKDLFDAGVVTTKPSEYFRTHQSILAAIEGGDVEWDRLDALEGDLVAVATRITEYVLELADRPSSPRPPRRKRPDELFERVETLLQHFPGDRRDRLLVLLRGLRDADGTRRYTDALGKFVAEIGTDRSTLGDTYDGLLNRAPRDPAADSSE